MSQPSTDHGQTGLTALQQEAVHKAQRAMARFEQLMATHGITPESCMAAVHRIGGEQAVNAVRRAVDEKLLDINARVDQARVHTPPKSRVSARMLKNCV